MQITQYLRCLFLVNILKDHSNHFIQSCLPRLYFLQIVLKADVFNRRLLHHYGRTIDETLNKFNKFIIVLKLARIKSIQLSI